MRARTQRRIAIRKALLAAASASAIFSGALAQVEDDADTESVIEEDRRGVGDPRGVAAGGAPLRMRSEYFGYSASVSPRVGYSDNIFLNPEGFEESSVFGSVLFSGAAIYSTRRFTGVASGDVDLSYIGEGSDFVVNQRVGAASTLTGVDNLLYLDLAGSTSRQLFGENARFSQNINAARNQRVDVHNVAASPYLYREFADRSAATLRYRFSQVFIDDDSAAANPFSGGFLNDSRSHEAMASYNTGGKFQRFRFAVSAYGNQTVEDGSVVLPRFEFQQGTATAEAMVALTSDFALSGAVGYDDIDTDIAIPLFDDDELSGVFWRAGFTATPGRRTYARIEYGQRYDDEFIDADIAYRLSDRLLLRAGASQSFRTRAQAVSASFIDQQRLLLNFADQLREGRVLSPDAVIATANRFANASINAQTAGIGVSKSAYAELRAVYDRTEFSASGYYEDTDFSFRRNKIAAASVDVRREMSRRLSGYAGVFWRRSETLFDPATCLASPFLFGFDVTDPLFDPVVACMQFALVNGRTNTVGGRVGAAYRIYENLAAFAEYSHTKRLAADPAASLIEYDENAVLAGVRLDF